MKKLLVSLMIAVTALSLVAEVSARPLGGGRSIGRQSPTVTRQATAAPAPTAARPATPVAGAPAPAAPAVKPPSPWKGILGGALLGLGLGALFSHFGLGGAMGGALGSILMIALLAMAAMFVWRMFRRNAAPAVAPAYGFNQPAMAGGPSNVVPLTSAYTPEQPVQPAPASAAPWGVPADFDAASFLRQSKSSFIRMQAAWDKADVNDLREFTTPEVFAELRLQIQERGANADFTDVELLGIETSGHDQLASVKFTGMIKSAPSAAAEPFAEVWNMSKPLNGSAGWLLAGIQQLS